MFDWVCVDVNRNGSNQEGLKRSTENLMKTIITAAPRNSSIITSDSIKSL